MKRVEVSIFHSLRLSDRKFGRTFLRYFQSRPRVRERRVRSHAVAFCASPEPTQHTAQQTKRGPRRARPCFHDETRTPRSCSPGALGLGDETKKRNGANGVRSVRGVCVRVFVVPIRCDGFTRGNPSCFAVTDVFETPRVTRGVRIRPTPRAARRECRPGSMKGTFAPFLVLWICFVARGSWIIGSRLAAAVCHDCAQFLFSQLASICRIDDRALHAFAPPNPTPPTTHSFARWVRLCFALTRALRRASAPLPDRLESGVNVETMRSIEFRPRPDFAIRHVLTGSPSLPSGTALATRYAFVKAPTD